uniref:Putative salivary kunitz domain protein n=1 Tax=Ixodes ricinus TaxID=34613 RepID=A0A0K8RD81_IXORI
MMMGTMIMMTTMCLMLSHSVPGLRQLARRPKRESNTPTAQPMEVALYVPDEPRIPKVCTEELDEGECGSNEEGTPDLRYFYDAAKNSCDMFPYSGLLRV